MNKALLVGINNYPDPRNQLEGCLNDINDMANYLVSKCDFHSTDIQLLSDERATKMSIMNCLGDLLAGVRPGDRILFHYSGHGAELPVRDPGGNVIAIHDTICPVDFDFTPDTSITDLDFTRLFSSVSMGVEFIWISDSCYSGGLLRGIIGRGKPRTFLVPANIAWDIKKAKDKNLRSISMAKSVSNSSVVLMSGCTATQESSDASFNNRPNGAFTYSLLKQLQIPDGNAHPLTAVISNTAAFLAANTYDQTPQLLGNAEIQNRAFMSAA